MRLSTTVLAVIAFLLAGVVSALAARVAVGAVEEQSVAAVQAEIAREGHDWARVLGDGLQVIIEGEAPSEAARFRAMSIAGGIVDASRVIDNIRVADNAGIAAPEFAIEILRNDSGVSLIGLIPARSDREDLSADIARLAGGAPVTDLLQTADYPVPESWPPAMGFALDALGRLPRSKISVEAGHVAVTAISDSLAEQRRIEADLRSRVPDGVRLTMNISAPRPVISPFTVRFSLDGEGGRFDACSADSEEERDVILSAARAAGVEGPLACTLGLGVPTRRWGPAVAAGIAAVAEMGAGSITFSNADVVLVGADGTDLDLFDAVAGQLANDLPEVFSLEVVRPVSSEGAEEGPPVFFATLSTEGRAQVRGRVHDALMNDTVANFARAQFGADQVTLSTRIAPDGLPSGWSVRVLAGIEALSMLSSGSVRVLPDEVTVTGETGSQTARDEITRLFIDKLGRDARFRIDIAYVEALDPLAGLPTPEECVAAIRAVTEGRKITFEPGSATLNADAMPIIDDIAEVLRLCGDLRLRIAGYTDSQGREETNLRLSQQRAESVLDALRMRRVPVGTFEAVGYGAENPIADNGTEEGREANRRIEFSLIGAEGDVPEGAGDAATVAPAVQPETRPRARPEERPELSSVTEEEAAAEPVDGPADDATESGEPASEEAATAEVADPAEAAETALGGVLGAAAVDALTTLPEDEAAAPAEEAEATAVVDAPAGPDDGLETLAEEAVAAEAEEATPEAVAEGAVEGEPVADAVDAVAAATEPAVGEETETASADDATPEPSAAAGTEAEVATTEAEGETAATTDEPETAAATDGVALTVGDQADEAPVETAAPAEDAVAGEAPALVNAMEAPPQIRLQARPATQGE
jgi:OOP family OmpA-OmpF porin